MILTIAKKELRAYLTSPLSWIMFALVQILLGLQFWGSTYHYIDVIMPQVSVQDPSLGVTDAVVVTVYELTFLLLLFMVPLFAMKIFAEERNNNTLTLLISAPLSNMQIVLGKYLGLIALLMIAIIIYSLMPLTISFFTPIDFGIFISALTLTFLVVFAFAAIGVFMSSITRIPALAAISTFLVLIFLLIINFTTIYMPDSWYKSVLEYVAIIDHIDAFNSGKFSSSNFIYFILLSVLFLGLTIRKLDNERLNF